MKTHRLLAACVIGFLAASGFTEEAENGAQSWSTSYGVSLRKARESGRPLLISFHAEWCGWCKLMERDVFTDAAVRKDLEDFVCLKIDADQDETTAMAFHIGSLPRTVVVNTNGFISADHVGYMDADRLRAWLAASLASGARGTEQEKAPGVEDAAALVDLGKGLAALQPGAGLPPDILALLGHSDPEIRGEVRRVLVGVGRPVIPALIKALGHGYLGVRVAAAGLLREIAGEASPLDPWAAENARHDQAAAWQKWFADAKPPEADRED